MDCFKDELFNLTPDEKALSEELFALSAALVEELKKNKAKISFAESCTGGMLAKLITDISGSSEVFECGIVSYSNSIKMKVLGVKPETIEKYTEVSELAATEMAAGALKVSGADFALATTGASGPGGAGNSPAGVSFIALASKNHIVCEKLDLSGKNLSRNMNRMCTAKLALIMALQESKEKEE